MGLIVLSVPHGDEDEADADYAVLAARDCLRRGELPLASHLLFTDDPVMRDLAAAERVAAMVPALACAERVGATVVYVDRGVTRRMVETIVHAYTRSRPIAWRCLCGDLAIHLTEIVDARRAAGITEPLEAFHHG